MCLTDTDRWDEMSMVWEYYENFGLTEKLINKAAQYISSRVLVVGSGLGKIVKACQQLGCKAIGIDFSSRMVERSKKLRHINAIQGSADQLPWPDQHFATVIISTGVLEPSKFPQCCNIVLEAKRVAQKHGTLLITVHMASKHLVEKGNELGYFQNNIQYNKRLLELWQSYRNENKLISYLMKYTSLSRFQAEIVIEANINSIYKMGRFFDNIGGHLRKNSINPVRFLNTYYATEVVFFDWKTLYAMLNQTELTLINNIYDKQRSCRLIISR